MQEPRLITKLKEPKNKNRIANILLIIGILLIWYYLTGLILIAIALYLKNQVVEQNRDSVLEHSLDPDHWDKRKTDTMIGNDNTVNQVMNMSQIAQPVIKHCKACGVPFDGIKCSNCIINYDSIHGKIDVSKQPKLQ